MNKFTLLILTVLLISGCKPSQEEADMIIYNAKIYSVDADFNIFEAMAIRDGQILALGSREELEKKYKGLETKDLNGMFVYPGFIDPHCHFYGYGNFLQSADLTGTGSFDEILGILEEHSRVHPMGWITGRGWDQNDWEVKRFPDRTRLDEMFPERPVILIRIDGHAALVNSVALKKAGITENTKVEGGEIEVMDGQLTGILIDNAITLVQDKIPQPEKEEIRRSLLDSQEKCFAVGLTSVHDAGLEKEVIDNIREMHKNGELKMKIYAMLSPTDENINHYLRQGIFTTERLSIRSVKLFMDGALGSRGARLLEPYSDDPDNYGLFLKSEDYIREIALQVDSFGYQVNTHCIGDAANRKILEIYSDLLGGPNDKRWRIEHAQIVNPDDYSYFSEYNIIPSIQTTHATSDMYWADERLGERIRHAYTYRSLLNTNGWLPNGSDFPIESINPLLGFYAGVARKDLKAYPEGGFQPEEALNREQALRAMTIWAARAGFEENRHGSLEPGKSADFVILDTDLMEDDLHKVPEASVLSTVILGEEVYTSQK